LNFGTRGHIIDVLTRAKFGVSRLGSFGVLIRQIFPFPIGLGGRRYKSVYARNAVLHRDERGEGGSPEPTNPPGPATDYYIREAYVKVKK